MVKVILLALDGSKSSERALPVGCELARALSAKLVLVCVAGPDAVVNQALTEQDRQEIAEQYAGIREEDHLLSFDPRRVEHVQEQVRVRAEVERYLEKVKKEIEATGLDVETAVPYGPAAEGILTEVEVRAADLVVMATHGRTGLRFLREGSVAQAVLKRCTVPVMIIPPGE